MSETQATRNTRSASTNPAAFDRGLMSRLVAAAVVGLIIIAECTAAYFLLPSPEALSDAVNDAAQNRSPSAKLPVTARDEVPLGRFSVTKQRPGQDSIVRIEFNLVYTVSSEDKREFSGLLATHTNRLRDRVIFIVRNSEISDLADPGLDLIKRRILETSNALLGQPTAKSVLFSDYSIIEL